MDGGSTSDMIVAVGVGVGNYWIVYHLLFYFMHYCFPAFPSDQYRT